MTTQDCTFDDDLRCIYCGYQARRPNTRRNCSRPEAPRGIFDRVSRYATAVARWIAAGRPVRTDAEVEGLLAICSTCPHYRAGACGKCGCPANRSASGWRNKLRMATESCPVGSWGPGSPPDRPERTRVGFVLPNLVRGGVERWLASLVHGLEGDPRVEVSGIAFTGSQGTFREDVAAEIRAPIVGAIDSPTVHRVASPQEAIYAVARGSDVLVVWSLDGRGREACEATGLPIVGVSHGCADWWMREAVDTVDRWVAVSEAARGPIPADDVAILWNGIDIERTRPNASREAVRAQAGIPVDARLVVSVGRLSCEKRLDRIVRSMEHLPPDVWLWLVGDGLERQALVDLAGSRVVISPSRPDVGNVLAAADAFAFCSEAEGYGLAPVEAMAYGLPLVSTRVGILPDLDVALGRPAAIYVPDDPAPIEIAAGLREALAGPRLVDLELADLIIREHSEAAMARRWSTYLEGLRCRSAARA